MCWKSPVIKLSVVVHLCFVTLAPSSGGTVPGAVRWLLASSEAGPSEEPRQDPSPVPLCPGSRWLSAWESSLKS